MWWLWIVIPVGIFVGLIVVVAVVGALLPREHQATRTAEFAAAPESVFQTITDFQARPEWLSMVKSAERRPDRDGHPVWRETWGFGESVEIEIVEFDPPRRFVSQIVHDGKRPFGGRWIHEVSPSERGCVLTITEDGWVSNPVFRFLARFVFGHAATLEKFLGALRVKLDEGGRG